MPRVVPPTAVAKGLSAGSLTVGEPLASWPTVKSPLSPVEKLKLMPSAAPCSKICVSAWKSALSPTSSRIPQEQVTRSALWFSTMVCNGASRSAALSDWAA